MKPLLRIRLLFESILEFLSLSFLIQNTQHVNLKHTVEQKHVKMR